MGVVVDRGAAAVHADLPGPDWRERAYGTRPGVIQRKRHRVSPSEGVGPKTKRPPVLHHRRPEGDCLNVQRVRWTQLPPGTF
ncbi:hypothetical protein C7S13_6488 [Burkholderia cepacia]|nr:hypothetical protein [Burkholderia cepacia]